MAKKRPSTRFNEIRIIHFGWQGVIAEIIARTETATINVTLKRSWRSIIRWGGHFILEYPISRYDFLQRCFPKLLYCNDSIVGWRWSHNNSNLSIELLHVVNLIFLTSNNGDHAYYTTCNYKSANRHLRLYCGYG